MSQAALIKVMIIYPLLQDLGMPKVIISDMMI